MKQFGAHKRYTHFDMEKRAFVCYLWCVSGVLL